MTASYNAPASQWTSGIDRALSEWNKEIWGSADLKIGVDHAPLPGLLAFTGVPSYVPVGKLADGRNVSIPQAAAKFQGYTGSGNDMNFTINQSYPFSFGGPAPGKYSYDDLMRHELGHGLFALSSDPNSGITPYDLWTEKQSRSWPNGHTHIDDPNDLMNAMIPMNASRPISDLNRQALGASGIPTYGDDTFYLMNGAKVDGGPGNNKAYWLDTFDNYNASLSNINRLIMGGQNPLNQRQQDVYRLYKAGLNREPDLDGFKFWNGSGKDMMQMANDFVSAPEFAPMASAPDNRSYIAGLYKNILGRDPDAGGLDYWAGRTDLNKGGLLANIALAPENKIGEIGFSL